MSSNYQNIKTILHDMLCRESQPLPVNLIAEKVNKVNRLLSIPEYAKLYNIEYPVQLSEYDWKRLTRELEAHFDVEMQKGVLIQGDEQRTRDTTWWTGIYKQRIENYYWNRYREYLLKKLPPTVIKTIDDDTDIVMNNIENPEIDKFSQYGMVVGHVQSGKTGNYSALICKAADAGYKFIVVIAGGINNLRNQTQERIEEAFIGQFKGKPIGAGVGNSNREHMPISLTTRESDFNKQDADRSSQGITFDNVKVPVLLVIKKNTKTLKNVIDWLSSHYKNKVSAHAMLIIDDESDYASINTNEEEDPTVINKNIRKLLGIFQKSAYVAYTATPYANIFIDHEAANDNVGIDLFPKDFIFALEAPSNYFGAKKIFIDEDGKKHLIPIDDYQKDLPNDHKKEHKVTALPESLKDAIRSFIAVIAIRRLRGQVNSHNSMLIHASRFTGVHAQISIEVANYLEMLKKEILAYSLLPDATELSSYIDAIKNTYNLRFGYVEFEWQIVLQQLSTFIEGLIIREVHQKSKVPLEYRSDMATNVIVIGGASLSRGYTVEGLSVSYFLRNTIYYDTLMQMGRWFGYREGYEDLCKIYLPEQRISDFADIITATEELFADFKLMAEHNKTPNDFGLAVRQNPDSALQITARNKLKNVTEFTYHMRLDGTLKETSYLRDNENDTIHNLSAIDSMVNTLSNIAETTNRNGVYIWRYVNKSYIQDFLSTFRLYERDQLGLSTRMPIRFIMEYIKDRNTDWDVVLYSGSGEVYTINGVSIRKQIRKMRHKDGYYDLQNRQVSSGGSAEGVAIEDAAIRVEIGDDRRKARQMIQRPLLMLHILQPNITSINESTPNFDAIAAFGISFPGSVLSDEQTVTLKINTVFFKNLFSELGQNNEEDD
ncbi:MAG: endonuclease [Chitinophagia bacterium]|nr:endonuclease [Chitinophagia bacterium]